MGKQSSVITQEQWNAIQADTVNFQNAMNSSNKEFYMAMKLLFYNIHMWVLPVLPSIGLKVALLEKTRNIMLRTI